MTGCSTPGNRIWYSTSSNPKRKLKHSLEFVETDDEHLACVNTIRANQLVSEILELGLVDQVPKNEQFRREVAIPGERGRFDFGSETTVIEVKSVTWGIRSIGRFPDARSLRATRHVQGLRALAKQGFNAILFFAVLHTGVERVTVATEFDTDYASATRKAIKENVRVLAYRWKLSPTAMTLDQEIPFYLES